MNIYACKNGFYVSTNHFHIALQVAAHTDIVPYKDSRKSVVLYSWTLQSDVCFQTGDVETYRLVDSCSELYFAIKYHVCDTINTVGADTDNTVYFAATLLFLAVSIFGGECWRRDWLMYPNFNYLSWSYGLAVISMFFHGFAAFFVYLVSLCTLIFMLHYYSALHAETVCQAEAAHGVYQGYIIL